MKDAQAILVLPPAARGAVQSPDLRRWLARGNLAYREPDGEILGTVLDFLGAPMPDSGLGGIRFWGQSGERSGAWMVAADPVHLETRMRDVRIRHFAPGDYDESDLDELVEALQENLGDDDGFEFVRVGSHAYVRASEPFDAPTHSTAVINGQVPDPYTPNGPGAGMFHRLLGETEMIVHGHHVNERRAATGKPMINSFWFWGGGTAPKQTERGLPPLFSCDPLFRGYWFSAGGAVTDWRGDLAECADASDGRFVAVLPDLAPATARDVVQQSLSSVREHLHGGALSSVAIFFRDGLQATMRRLDRFMVWRKSHSLLEEAGD